MQTNGLSDPLRTLLKNTSVKDNVLSTLTLWRMFEFASVSFISTTEESNEQTYAHIPNTIRGYYDEMLKMAQVSTSVPKVGDPVVANPFSIKLRPVDNIASLGRYEEVFLSKITYRIADATINDAEGLAANQDATMLSIMQNSILNTTTDAYSQSRFRFGEVGGYALTCFRPYLTTNGGRGISLFGASRETGLQNPTSKEYFNMGDYSVGKILPYEVDLKVPISLGKINGEMNGIEIFAFAGQLFNDSGTIKILRFPIIAEMELLLLKHKIVE